MDIFELLNIARSKNASDLHISAGNPPLIRINGNLTRIDNYIPLTVDEVESTFMQLTSFEGLEKFQKTLELDFKYVLPDGSSLRCNAAQERGHLSL